MLVMRVIGDCPGCGAKDAYGNVSVTDDHVLRGCRRCDYQACSWLPSIQKKVIYLDQFFFSGAMRGRDARFEDVANRVRRACHLQLLIAPYSSVHEDEAQQWRGHLGMTNAQLVEFIKDTARGAEFEKDYAVEHAEVFRAWQAFLDRRPAEYTVDRNDGLQVNLTQWDDYFRIDVGGYFRDIELKRRLKAESVEELLGVLDAWRASKRTFEQAVALEIGEAGRQYLDFYITKHRRLAQGDFTAAIDSPISSNVVEQMMHWLPEDQSVVDKLRRCAEFFGSEHFSNVPNHWIYSHMFATLKEILKAGGLTNPDTARKTLTGAFEDIRHISLYAPYCDAIVIDNFMADLVSRPGIRLEQRYGVKVFSLSSWDRLITWLNELEAGMSAEHRAGIEAAYPSAR
ncbi:hypothetical protein [Variovorax sp. PvP013]|uniref:hypothetical protein n=1 Tax=Variovorax sp. PvP013 TaxID=3156435 RepID=UPI003D1BD4EA